MNLYLHNTDQVLLFGPFICFVFEAVMPFENLLGPVGDLYCLSNTFRKLVLTTLQNFVGVIHNITGKKKKRATSLLIHYSRYIPIFFTNDDCFIIS